MNVPLDTPRTAGFGIRLAAMLFDAFLFFALVYAPLMVVFGHHVGVLTILIDIGLVLFIARMWQTRCGTPGKLLLGLRVVDATTFGPLRRGQAIGRCLAYLVSSIPLCLGFVWIFFDPKHQAWHDKLAGTLVVHAPRKAALEAPEDAPTPTPQVTHESVIQPG